MKLRNMNISTRLGLGFAAMALLMAMMGGLAWIKLNAMDNEFHLAFAERYPRTKAFNGIKDLNNQLARSLSSLLIVTDKADLDREFAVQADVGSKSAAALDTLGKGMSTPASQAAFARLMEARAAFGTEMRKVQEAVKAGDLESARTVLIKDLRPKQNTYMASVDEMLGVGDKLMAASRDESAAEAREAKIEIAVLLLVALGMALAVSWGLVRSISGPLNEAVKVATGVADGDLAMPIEAGGSNETGRLLNALHLMQTRLAAIVREVREGAESVATASAQISSGNNDLSSRTEQQASALEETAASMEELGGTVRGNAESAQQADQLAKAASSVAAEGGAAVGQVVETMREISASSQKIADIIGVIDSIAFQTNILALNAAVEAARAGEQGRGFAVVASEVRALAQRSADAAKEIKTLIGASVDRVELGSSQVGTAGGTIDNVVASIRRVTDIMGEISAASREQSSAVSQVSEAVTQMDRATQENAALVEESAAAAESLKTQAQQLVQAVAVFRLAPA